eukprot:2755231-Rhodomonas_salina.1
MGALRPDKGAPSLCKGALSIRMRSPWQRAHDRRRRCFFFAHARVAAALISFVLSFFSFRPVFFSSFSLRAFSLSTRQTAWSRAPTTSTCASGPSGEEETQRSHPGPMRCTGSGMVSGTGLCTRCAEAGCGVLPGAARAPGGGEGGVQHCWRVRGAGTVGGVGSEDPRVESVGRDLARQHSGT